MQKLPSDNDVLLLPGEYFFGGYAGPVRVHTLLGSCVAITLWHPRKRIGGMCHYLLPASGKDRRLSQGYYADGAMEMFMKSIEAAATHPREYEINLFGGGKMFPARAHAGDVITISNSNIEAGRRLLRERGFIVKSADVGGTYYRRVYMELWSGKVWVQHGRGVAKEMR